MELCIWAFVQRIVSRGVSSGDCVRGVCSGAFVQGIMSRCVCPGDCILSMFNPFVSDILTCIAYALYDVNLYKLTYHNLTLY